MNKNNSTDSNNIASENNLEAKPNTIYEPIIAIHNSNKIESPFSFDEVCMSKLKPKKPDYSFQEILVKSVQQSLKKSDGVILAAGCGSGKTNMAIEIIERFLSNPNRPEGKILVLTHGQSVLRKQFSERVMEVYSTSDRKMRAFSYTEIKGSLTDFGKSDVIIALPHAFNQQKRIKGKVALVIIDEAHQFFSSEMVQRILRKFKPAFKIMLTGTPSSFVRSKEFPIIPMPVCDLLEHNAVSDATVEIVESAYRYNSKAFNNDQEIKTTFKFKTQETSKTLDSVLSYLVAKVSGHNDWLSVSDKLKKTFIACNNRQQANQVSNYLKSKKVACALSTSADDRNGNEIQRFMDEKDCKILVVVGRGVLGFNMPEIKTVIDLTGSHNPDRIFQLLSRVTRLCPEIGEKIFIKVTNRESYLKTYYYTSVAVGLASREIMLTYDGTVQSLMGLEVQVPKAYKDRLATHPNTSGCKTDKSQNFNLPPILKFRELINRGGSVETKATITLSSVKKSLGESSNEVDEIKGKLIQMAKDGAVRPFAKAKGLEERSLGLRLKYYLKNDLSFRTQIYALAPTHWKLSNPSVKKQTIIEHAKNGVTRSDLHSSDIGLYHSMMGYLNPNSNSFDAKLKRTLKKMESDFVFTETSNVVKRNIVISEILAWTRINNNKPATSSRCKHEKRIAANLQRLTCSTNKSFDEGFNATIRRIKPEWFIEGVLLSLPKNPDVYLAQKMNGATPKLARSLENIKTVCDELDESGDSITTTKVAVACVESFGSPQLQSIRNNHDLRNYILIRIQSQNKASKAA
jgi:superfamily II DNA or RNA helicase